MQAFALMMGDEFGGPVPVGPFRLIGSEAIGTNGRSFATLISPMLTTFCFISSPYQGVTGMVSD